MRAKVGKIFIPTKSGYLSPEKEDSPGVYPDYHRNIT
jgi:hypothetical protein